MRLIFFYFMTVLGISACQTGERAQDKQLTLDCYVRVLEQEGNILAEATMLSLPPKGSETPANSIVPIEIPGGIRYQGSPMNTRPNAGLTYTKQYPGGFVPEHIFSWDDSDKVRHNLTLKMNSVTAFSFGSKAVSLSQPARLTWEGGPSERGEVFVLMWENIKGHQTVPMEVIVQGQLPQIDFPVGKLKELTPGEWTLYIVRKKLVKEQTGGISAKAVLEFYSKTQPLTLTQ